MKKKEKFEKTLEELRKAKDQTDVALSPLIDDKDLLLLTTAKVKLSQNDILKLYVKNANELDLK